jgi:hypothetical protein
VEKSVFMKEDVSMVKRIKLLIFEDEYDWREE